MKTFIFIILSITLFFLGISVGGTYTNIEGKYLDYQIEQFEDKLDKQVDFNYQKSEPIPNIFNVVANKIDKMIKRVSDKI